MRNRNRPAGVSPHIAGYRRSTSKTMKAITPRLPLILLALAGSTLCTAVLAEDTTPPPPPPQHGPGMPGGMFDPAKRLAHLTKQLGLTPEQQEKIRPILVEQADLMKKAADARTRLEAVLTPEQREKFDERHQSMREHRGQRGTD
jgi:Spy/CpxP family protein refolding chaperone